MPVTSGGFMRILKARPISESVVACLMSFTAAGVLLRIFWPRPDYHLWGTLGAIAIVLVVLAQLRLVYTTWREARSIIERENPDPVLQKTLNRLLQTFNFANGLTLIISILVLGFMHMAR